MKLSLAITTFNRYDFTIESFAQVIDDPRIDDIVILDDCSTDGSFEKLVEYFKGNPKVRVIRQAQNRGMSQNKADAIAHCQNEWVIIFDSDNIIGRDYLDAFYELAVVGDALNIFKGISEINKFIFCPDFAKPQFDYREFKVGNGGIGTRAGIYGAHESAREIKHDSFNCLMNTCNYIVHRDYYLSTYKYNKNHVASDTIWHNYSHLKTGGLFVVVPDMQYQHRVHPGSGFLQDADYNMKKSAEVRRLIQCL